MRSGALALCLAALASVAGAAPTLSRRGGAGLLDVLGGELLERGAVAFGAELFVQSRPGQPATLGPSPIFLGVGLSDDLELGFHLREGGAPGDPEDSALLFGGGAKVRLLPADGWRPALAFQAGLDFIDTGPAAAVGFGASTEWHGLRFAGSIAGEVGLHAPGSLGLNIGAAAAYRYPSGVEVVMEVVERSGEVLIGGGGRYPFAPGVGVSAGATWLTRDQTVRFFLGLGFDFRRQAPAGRPPPLPPDPPRERDPERLQVSADPPRLRLVGAESRVGEPAPEERSPDAVLELGYAEAAADAQARGQPNPAWGPRMKSAPVEGEPPAPTPIATLAALPPPEERPLEVPAPPELIAPPVSAREALDAGTWAWLRWAERAAVRRAEASSRVTRSRPAAPRSTAEPERAVLGAHLDLRACIDAHLPRAAGSLTLTVDPSGAVTGVTSNAGEAPATPRSGPSEAERAFDDCVRSQRSGWRFPAAGVEYDLRLPVELRAAPGS